MGGRGDLQVKYIYFLREGYMTVLITVITMKYSLQSSKLYNKQIKACALIGQSAMVYCAAKLMEKSCVF